MDQRQFTKSLRQNMTDAEQLLWRHLRAHRMDGQKFRRQQPLGPYIVDFVHFGLRLIVEADGGQHVDSEHDATRDAWRKDAVTWLDAKLEGTALAPLEVAVAGGGAALARLHPVALEHEDSGHHDGERLALAALTLTQLRQRIGVRGVAHQMEAAEAQAFTQVVTRYRNRMTYQLANDNS